MLSESLALMALVMWPFVPISLVGLHAGIKYWRKIGTLTYLILFFVWAPVGYLIFQARALMLADKISLPDLAFSLGLLIFISGIALHLWTIKLLGIKATIGYYEIYPNAAKGKLITSGPFSAVRHPSYLAHSLILLGIFLMAPFYSTGLLLLVDFLIAYFLTTELEEKELKERFGGEYLDYMKRTPKFFPNFFR